MRSDARPTITTEGGFTLIEVLIAGLILTVGLLTLAYGYGQGMVSVLTAQEDTVAREKAREALESIVTALNTKNIDFTNNLCNVSAGVGCVIVDGFTPLYNAGADGIYGTADDSVAGVQSLVTPGPDGILGTADDVTVPLSGFQRQIVISTTGMSTVKRIDVTIQYTTAQGLTRSVVVTTYVSPYV